MPDSHERCLAELLDFIASEQRAGMSRLLGIWERPLAEKLATGWTQRFERLERGDERDTVHVWFREGEARFREGDLLLLHTGNPIDDLLARGLTFESELDDHWVLRGRQPLEPLLSAYEGGELFADADTLDLTGYYRQAIEEIGTSQIGREVVLPLLSRNLEPTFITVDVDEGLRIARHRRFNDKQAEAVGLAFGAEQLACIQGPPGTGKSSVLALIARLMVERGQRVLLTSHTHMAINNALNKIARENVPVVKIGLRSQCKALDAQVRSHEAFAAWSDRPEGGYVIGATPFATCTERLKACEFDTVLFDEASQVTVPLALMAMRKARRFIFVGDQQQLPPVMLSRSVLDKSTMSAFARLVAEPGDHSVMLDETYRMSQWLTAWPSKMYYGERLRSVGENRERRLQLRTVPERFAQVFAPSAAGVFIPTQDRASRTHSPRDARLVAGLCVAAVAGGLSPSEIGVVTPYRAQGKAVRSLLAAALGHTKARDIVADTVERMQGQERELVILSLASGDEVFLSAVAEFFFQPQRLNVSITRAKSKLIVIGPQPAAVPELEPPHLKEWVAQYLDFLRQLTRVEIPETGS
jgi:DNA replication ATP-dependent helicase Dna2